MMIRCRLLGVLLVSAVPLFEVGIAAELRHFWDFEGEQWWLDKEGEAHGVEPSDRTTLRIEPGVGGVGQSVGVATAIRGGDDHLVVAADELFQPGDEAFSFFFWVRMPDDMTTDPRGIFDFSGNGGDGVQSLYIGGSGELAFRIDFPGAGNALAKVPIDLEDGEWHSVAATFDPQGRLELHIDGFGVDGFADAVNGPVSMASDAYLGSFNFTGTAKNNGIGGNIDNFAIYSGILSEAEITALSTPLERPDLRIETITLADDGLTITWNGLEGEAFEVWSSQDLDNWVEIDDSVLVGPEGAIYTVNFGEVNPSRIFLQVRRRE